MNKRRDYSGARIRMVQVEGPWHRMHMVHKDPVKFEDRGLFRFDSPSDGGKQFETLYVGITPAAAFLETLGGLRPLPERLINERTITEIERPEGPLRLADLTDLVTLRLLGLEYDPYVRDYVSRHTDCPGLDYGFTQKLASDLWHDGCRGVLYFTANQDQFIPSEKSAALFAEPEFGVNEFKASASVPVRSDLLSTMQRSFGIEILPADTILW
jgi:hypothetical protein